MQITHSLPLTVFLIIAGFTSGCTMYMPATTPGTSPSEVNLPSGHRTTFTEKETPAGQVPPPPPNNPPAAAQQQSATGATSLRQSGQQFRIQAQDTINAFSKAYAAKGSPRIAIWFNRSLSSDVREWQSDQNVAVDYQEQHLESVSESPSNPFRTNLSASIVVAVQKPADSGEHHPPTSEAWTWAFEDGFLKPVLEAKARAVDRAVMLRLAAESNQLSANSPTSPKQLEVTALRNYSEILVEILIAPSPATVYGYDFKASAKEINSGLILASVTSSKWSCYTRKGYSVMATSNGYKVQEAQTLPAAQDVAYDLAIDLLGALCCFGKRAEAANSRAVAFRQGCGR